MVGLTALDQIRAIIRLRSGIAVNSLRRSAGISDLVSISIILLVGGSASIGIAVLFGFLTHSCVASGDLDTLRFNLKIAFYAFFVIGIVFPIVFNRADLGIDIAPFRIYPISPNWLFAITAGSGFGSPEHLFYYPSLAVIFFTCVLTAGWGAAAGAAALLLLLFFYVMLGSAIALAMQLIMRKRRTSEILTVVFISVIIALWLVFQMARFGALRQAGSLGRIIDHLRVIQTAGRYLPPSLAADAVTSLHAKGDSSALRGVMLLFCWTAAVTAAGRRAFMRLHAGEKGKAGKRAGMAVQLPVKEDGPATFHTGEIGERAPTAKSGAGIADVFIPARLLLLPQDVCAMAAKELRYLLRSALGKSMILIAPAVAVAYSFLLMNVLGSAAPGMRSGEFGLFAIGVYLAMVMSNNICNSFLWEGKGIQAYFSGPAPLTSVIAGKNLGAALYITLLFLLCAAAWGVITRNINPATYATAFLVFANSILTLIMAGNFLSIKYALPHDPSRMRSAPSQAAQLYSLLVIIVILCYTAAVTLLPDLIGIPAMRPIMLAVLLGFQAAIYRTALRSAAALMSRSRDALISRLLLKS